MITSNKYIKIALTLLSAVLMIGFSSPKGFSQSDNLVKVKSSGSVAQTASKLKKMVSNNGMMVMGKLNQGHVLSMTGISVKSKTIFVGNPHVGKKLFSADAGVGIAVPIRINIYKDSNGQTWVSYIPPSKLLSNFNNPKIDKIAQMLDQKLKKMTSMIK